MGRVVDASSTSVSRSGWGSLTRWLCSNVTKSVARGAWPPTREHFPKTSSARTMRADPGTSGGPSAPLGVCCSFGMRPWPSPTIPTSHTSRRTSDGPFSAPYSRITHRALLSNLRRGFTGPSDMLTTQHPASSVLDIRLRINGLFHNAIFNGAVSAQVRASRGQTAIAATQKHPFAARRQTVTSKHTSLLLRQRRAVPCGARVFRRKSL